MASPHRVWLLAALLAAAGACGGDGTQPLAGAGGASTGVGGQVEVGGGGSLPVEEDPFDPPPDAEPLTSAQIDALTQQIDAILAPFGAQTHSVLLMGADTHQVIYERNPDALLKPASNTKLFTSATAMSGLGDEHRITTSVYATVAPSAGVIGGDLVLVGRHDFTWSAQFYASPRFPLDQLAEGLALLGVTQITGTVQVRGEVLYDGYQFASYDAAAHRGTAAVRFQSALSAVGISTGGVSTSPSMDPPAGATELVRWRSLPLSVACSPLNRISHNEFADILARHVGWELGGESSYAKGEQAVVDLLASAPAGTAGASTLDVSGVVLDDGSGLSHGNRVSARHVVALLDLMRERREGQAWSRTFSVAGVRGTLAGRMTGADTWGRMFGKTGTLSDTIALSGMLEHRHDGQRYWLSMLMNGVTSASAARAAHDDVVEALAADLRGQGERPDPPELTTVKNDANGQTLTLTWDEVDGADGYLVWRSVDGRLWPRSEARWVHTNRHRTKPIADATSLYVRVSAWSSAGPSDPSDVYAAGLDAARSDVLVVDGNDRWEREPVPENTLDAGHDFVAAYADVLAGLGFDACNNESVVNGGCPLADYPVVIWALGEESTDDAALDPAERAAIESYTAAGGNLLISGAELAWHLGNNGSSEEIAFLADVLRAAFAGDDGGSFTTRPSDALLGEGELLSFLTPDRMVINYPDVLTPVGGSEPFTSYVGGNGGLAGLRYDGSYRLVYLGFPFESIDAIDDRSVMMDAIMSFFAQ